jgi:ribonuclease R
MSLREDVLAALADGPLSQHELLQNLGLPRGLRRRLDDVVQILLEAGVLREDKGHRLELAGKPAARAGRLSGVLHFGGNGNGYLRVEGREEDLLIPASRLGWALPDDEVEAALLPPKAQARGPRRGPEAAARQAGEVLRVLRRGREQWVGQLASLEGRPCLRLHEGELELFLPLQAAPSQARPGDWVVAAAPACESERGGEPKAKVLSVLGGAGDKRLDTRILVGRHGLRESFPAEALAEAEKLGPEVPEQAKAGRLDLRDQVVFTIDGADAKDFDDAVSLEALEGGISRLGVHIADVSHYVRPGSALDAEALARGTSAYMPDLVLPMLPEAISNGLCSLKQGVDRLCLSALIDYDSNGQVLKARFAKSLIRSCLRLTYDQVQATFDQGAALPGPDGPRAQRTLLAMRGLAKLLIKRRHERGALDFDFPETKAEVGPDGSTVALLRRQRQFSHQLIEEFMIAANQAVAGALREAGVPALNRVHEEPDPDKLAETMKVLAGFKLGMALKPPVRPKSLQQIIERSQGRKEARLVQNLLLRSLRLARYTPEALGHFGLALEDYAHFTSPIRRYPDLQVHRALSGLLAKGSPDAERAQQEHGRLLALGEVCSALERKAEACERDCVKAKQIRFLEQKLGQEYDAIITGVARFGFFAEIKEFPAEGLVPLRSLESWYELDPKRHCLSAGSGKPEYSIGDEVRIKVKRADWESLQVDFALAEEP